MQSVVYNPYQDVDERMDQYEPVSTIGIVKPSNRVTEKKVKYSAGKYGKIAMIMPWVLFFATFGGLATIFILHFESQGTWNRGYMELDAKFQQLQQKNSNVTLQLRRHIGEIGRKANSGYADLDAKYQQLQEKHSNDTMQLRSDINEVERKANIGLCEVRYEDYCFFLGATGKATMNMNAARWFCERNDAKLGNIYSSKHFDMLTNYYRPYVGTVLNGNTLVGIKTGMTFDSQTQVVHLSDGSRAPFIRWELGQPTIEPQYSFIVMGIHAGETKARDGYNNYREDDPNFGALCQRRV